MTAPNAVLVGILLACTQALAQQSMVAGRVTSLENASPIPGVSVWVKGSTLGTVTDSLGKYSISLPNNTPAILVFRGIGLATKELEANGTQQHVELVHSGMALNEVVVTGYQTASRGKTNGSYAIVQGKSVENTPFISLDKALQGLVPGLQSLGSSGQPGSLQNVRIRGNGSLQASAEPLYVVNGIPINAGSLTRNTPNTNALSGISANDIESITILKDAAAASAYGSRAANGVVVIVLKSGRPGRTSFRFASEFGWIGRAYESPANRPLNTGEWRELTAEGVRNRFPGRYPNMASALQYVDESMGINPHVNTSWLKEVTRTGQSRQYHFSATGGDEKTRFYLSASHLSQTGNVISSDFNRTTGLISLDHRAGKKLSFKTSLLVGHTGQQGPDNGGAFSNPVLAAYFLRPSLSPRTPEGSPNISAPDFPDGGLYNPVAIAAMDRRKTGQLKGIGSLAIDYAISHHFKLTSRIGIDYHTLEEDSYNNPLYGDAILEKGLSARGYGRYFNWVWTNLAEYNRDFADRTFSLHLTGGYEAQKSTYYFNHASTYGLPANQLIQVPSAGTVAATVEGSNSDYAFLSMLALMDFSYRNKWQFSASFRRDGSSRFGTDHRYGNFWSVGLSWHVDREDFFKSVSSIDALKIRGSYGFNGNAGIGNYDWEPAYAYGKNYNYSGGTGMGLVTPGNHRLSWEFNKPLDFGLDMTLLGGRITLAADWYRRITSNLLIDQPLSGTSGFTSYKTNAGSMSNQGIEVAVSGQVLRSKRFTWNLSVSMSRNRNRIVSLPDNRDMVTGRFIHRTGNDSQSFYMRQWAGVDSQTGSPLWWVDGSRKEVTGSYNAASQALSGSAAPRAFGSFGSVLTYRSLSLDLQLYYCIGHRIYDAWAGYTQSDGANANFNVVSAQLRRWRQPGDQTNVPQYVYGGSNASNAASSRFLYQGDYVRLRNLLLAYTIPTRVLRPAAPFGLKLYLSGANLLTWVKDKNLPYDPEAGISSTTNFDIFVPRILSAGLQLTF